MVSHENEPLIPRAACSVYSVDVTIWISRVYIQDTEVAILPHQSVKSVKLLQLGRNSAFQPRNFFGIVPCFFEAFRWLQMHSNL